MDEVYIPQVGDIILVKGNAWLARAIQFFMRIYRKRKGLATVTTVTNHVALVVDLWGVLMVVESDAHGVQARYNVQDYISRRKVKIKRIYPPVHKDFSRIACQYFMIPHKYDFLNFIFQMILIWTGYWIGPTKYKATRRLYCSEYVAVVLDECYGIYKGRTWDKNPLDIDLTAELTDVYRNF